MNEEWRDIPDWEGIYQVSNQGRVRSLDRQTLRKDGVIQSVRGRIIRQGRQRNGYRYVNLYRRDGAYKCVMTHRIVLSVFDRLPKEGEVTMHLDNNPENNALSNLSWGTQSENLRHVVVSGNHRNANKKGCDLGHLYGGANSTPGMEGQARRKCRACASAASHVDRHPEMADKFAEIADAYYIQNQKEAQQ